MKAIIALDGRGLRSGEATRRFAIPASSMQAALESLEAGHVIRQDASGGAVHHRLVDPFLAGWLDLVQAL